MHSLERSDIAKLDKQNMLSSIEVLHQQCSDAWEATKKTEFPDSYRNVDRIVWFGMGGSALGIDVIKSLFSDEITLPIEIVNDYQIPATVTPNTLVILSSYSGTTEEVVEVSQTILDRTKNVFVVATGGDLETFASTHNLPAYIFKPEFNPSNQPRMAVGYAVMGTLGAFSSLGFVNISDEQVTNMTTELERLSHVVGADVPTEVNPIKQLAVSAQDKFIQFISSEFLLGATHVMTNQTNENGKHIAGRFPIPEMNHHLIEGLVYPKELLEQTLFVFITSDLYHPRNQVRHKVTAEVVEKNNIGTGEINLTGSSKFIQAFELLLYGSYLSFYLAMVHEIDPSPIPNVDYLKEALKKA
ncbi:MAG: hypothetical protein COW24_04070 [Candidatus Kerfeldbacteria bacterium CG15_BIG_FIL_POST_REV_8_21_14_020_45_12]|uniref:SIS domain-containing protein n=1 Tax=Candidatus Kerfeldbacteria bacterium CG15_BIG_FIL_POST_REV_8_21_14_020_45_12 TaxID=2014247 RepID=A0A2M7H3A6_9BACT|nr:MAG: hypothetical protein COW24_04070 [Candidatus Kerfeldbacteria bacterium CG15_BIG_FIL_POST_REV_8_21_14_020_45_12]PJA93863.1 MAG: hypothetical protein CO132_01215 [Candidatus Kerfeldbacteria bacterium CG_4_9_14_3_um_filter_45_8]